MRILGLALLSILALLAVLLFAADVVLTHIANRQGIHARIDAAVEEVLNREFEFGPVEVSLFPPSLVVVHAWVAGETPDAPRMLEAERVALEVALLPLLDRSLLIDALHIEGAVVRLVFTEDGLLLPEVGTDPDDPEGRGDSTEPDGPAFAIAVREVKMSDANLLFEDRTFSPPESFELMDAQLVARGKAFDEPFALSLDVAPGEGGRLTGRGTADLDGRLDLEVTLDEFPIDRIDLYLEQATKLRGRASGTVSIHGPFGAPDPLAAELEIRDSEIVLEEAVIEGLVKLRAELRGPFATARGHFEIDASAAALRYQQVWEKEPGRPAHVQGKLHFAPDGRIEIDEVSLKIGEAEANGRIEIDERTRIELSARPLELLAFAPLVRAFRDVRVGGRVELPRVELQTNPTEIRGELRAIGASLAFPDGGSIGLDGSVVADGTSLRTRDLRLSAGDEVVPVEGLVTDLRGDWRYDVALRADQVDAHRLISAVRPKNDSLHGTLTLDATASGALASEVTFLEALEGRMRVDIAPGRLTGISILEATFREFDRARSRGLLGVIRLPGLSSPLAPRLTRFYDDAFQSLGATLDVAGGTGRTSDFLLKTRSYDFKLAGLIELDGFGLDARGELVLGREFMGFFAGLVGLERLPVLDQVVIPLPAIEGTLADPKPQPDFSLLLRAFTLNLPVIRGIDRMLRDDGGMRRGLLRR